MVKTEQVSTSNGTQAAQTSGGGKNTGELVRQSNSWRDNYNPIRGLVIARVVAILEAADRGDYAELQLILRKIERRYPVLKGLKSRRLSAIEKLDWEIKTVDELPEGSTQAHADAQQKFLRSRYESISNLTEAIGFLVTPEFRGYSILQKHRIEGGPNDNAVGELHWLPQDQFSRDGQFGDFYYNKNSNFGIGVGSCRTILGETNRIGSDDLPREDFVIREVDSPIYEIALIAFVNWSMGRKDWAAFTEIFGLPNGVAIMPPNIPAGMEDEYRAAAEKVADGISGALPNGSDIKFPTASVRGDAPFKSFCDAQDSDVVLAGTGGRLSMLTAEKGGLGDGPAKEHADAFDEIAQADARKISWVLQQDFDRVELAAEFPGEPALAYFDLSAKDETDVAQLVTDIAALATAGYEADEAWLNEITGYKLGKVAAPVPPPQGDPRLNADLLNRRRIRNVDAGTKSVADATAEDMQPALQAINEGLQKIFTISDPALRLQKFRELWGSTTQIRADAAKYPAAALALQKINAESFARGLKGEEPVTNRIMNDDSAQPRDNLGRWVDENGGGLSEKENLQRGQKAMNRALVQKSDVQKAMYRKEVGQIDFPYGTPGDKGKDFSGGHGVSHIVAKHGEADARMMPEVIAKGKITSNPRDAENKKLVTHGGYEAALVKQNTQKAWLLTGFRKQVER